MFTEACGEASIDEAHWIGRLEDARKEIEEAATDREAIVIAFTELSRLLIDTKFDIESQEDSPRTRGPEAPR